MKCIVTCKDRARRGDRDADPVDFTFDYEYCCEESKKLNVQGIVGEIHFCAGVMGGGPFMARLKNGCYHGDGAIPLACPYCGAEITQITIGRKIDGTFTGYMDHKKNKWYDGWPKVVIRTYD